MNKNTVLHLKVYGIAWVLMFLILSAVMYPILKILGTYSVGKFFGIVIPLTFVSAFILLKVMYSNEKKNPIGKKYSELMKELRTNGYSDRFLAIIDEAVPLFAEKNDTKSNYYVTFMLHAASAYSMKKEYDKALNYINSIDTNEIRSKEQEFMDKGETLALYFNTQMGICQGIKDVARAENVLADAKSYIDRYYKAGGMNLLAIEDMYCSYYCLKGDYESEFAHATRIMESNLPDAAKNPMAYLRILEVYCKTGQKENADEMYKLLKNSLYNPKNSNAEILMKYADDVMAEII
ncbi:MAG: hypothetical protein J5476_01305 [Lachnospiraceae bacterium]|nr:hypothetical protein [Lachnospiraceae bacterium]